MNQREYILVHWLNQIGYASQTIAGSNASWLLSPLPGDASSRRYFRLRQVEQQHDQSKSDARAKSFIIMDSPCSPENQLSFTTFLNIANYWRTLEINVPQVLAHDEKQGFMLLSDFGDLTLLDKLQSLCIANDRESIAQFYHLAMVNLAQINLSPTTKKITLPSYEKTCLYDELVLFKHWFCDQLLSLNLTDNELDTLDDWFSMLVQSALQQPQVVVHKDYHSRNIMLADHHPLTLGIIDFQDVTWGPITYDIVSLLKDCYVTWPATQVEEWALAYRQQLIASSKEIDHSPISLELTEWTEQAWLKAFHLMGLQRHLKVLGIFSRLHLRDNKSRYLDDIPRTLAYILERIQTCSPSTKLDHLFYQRIIPAMQTSNYFKSFKLSG